MVREKRKVWGKERERKFECGNGRAEIVMNTVFSIECVIFTQIQGGRSVEISTSSNDYGILRSLIAYISGNYYDVQ